ncbi:MAG: L,D-transpeptidase family protein [Acidobacteriota bacterium]
MTARGRRTIALIVLTLLVVGALATYHHGRRLWVPAYLKVKGRRTVAEAVEQFAPDAEARLRPHFESAGVDYPPERLAFVVLKDTKTFELWADDGGGPTRVVDYPVLAASGGPGPKLREGDRQVPEGLYRISGLNPNSAFHLSMKVSYPNEHDLLHAEREGRTEPGSDIFIHGKAASIGCLAMGDPAIEELFVLTARVGRERVEVLIAPTDFRRHGVPPVDEEQPAWVPALHASLIEALARYPRSDR